MSDFRRMVVAKPGRFIPKAFTIKDLLRSPKNKDSEKCFIFLAHSLLC